MLMDMVLAIKQDLGNNHKQHQSKLGNNIGGLTY